MMPPSTSRLDVSSPTTCADSGAAESDDDQPFEFCSSRYWLSDSDQAPPPMYTADELFCDGRIRPLPLAATVLSRELPPVALNGSDRHRSPPDPPSYEDEASIVSDSTDGGVGSAGRRWMAAEFGLSGAAFGYGHGQCGSSTEEDARSAADGRWIDRWERQVAASSSGGCANDRAAATFGEGTLLKDFLSRPQEPMLDPGGGGGERRSRAAAERWPWRSLAELVEDLVKVKERLRASNSSRRRWRRRRSLGDHFKGEEEDNVHKELKEEDNVHLKEEEQEYYGRHSLDTLKPLGDNHHHHHHNNNNNTHYPNTTLDPGHPPNSCRHISSSNQIPPPSDKIPSHLHNSCSQIPSHHIPHNSCCSIPSDQIPSHPHNSFRHLTPPQNPTFHPNTSHTISHPPLLASYQCPSLDNKMTHHISSHPPDHHCTHIVTTIINTPTVSKHAGAKKKIKPINTEHLLSSWMIGPYSPRQLVTGKIKATRPEKLTPNKKVKLVSSSKELLSKNSKMITPTSSQMINNSRPLQVLDSHMIEAASPKQLDFLKLGDFVEMKTTSKKDAPTYNYSTSSPRTQSYYMSHIRDKIRLNNKKTFLPYKHGLFDCILPY